MEEKEKKKTNSKSIIEEKFLNGYYPSKKELEEYYIKEKHTRKECLQHFSMTLKEWQKITKKYNIYKIQPSQFSGKKMLLQNKEDFSKKKALSFEEKIQMGIYPSREQFNQDYIINNKSQKEMSEEYGFSTKIINQLSKYYNLYKTKEQSYQLTQKAVLEKYGVDNVFRSSLIKKQIQETCLLKYGTKTFGESEEFRKRRGYTELGYSVLKDKDSLEEYLLSLEKKPTIYELAATLGCKYGFLCRELKKWDLHNYVDYQTFASHYEADIQKWLELNHIPFIEKDRDILDGREIDIYIPSKKIGIEFNGTYWHSDKYVEKDYHYKKSLLAEQKGIRLIHIYENEWLDKNKQNKIFSLLRIALGILNTRIYARECVIKTITNQEAKPFNDANHLQGHRNAKVTYGLFYQGELVQLMSFGYNKKYEWEIIRGCPASNNIVVGGVSKLFCHFIKDYNPKEVFSYCDFNKFDGTGYEAIGMKMIGYTGPDKNYIINGLVFHRSPTKYKEYKEAADALLWGAGSKKYLWEKKDEQ